MTKPAPNPFADEPLPAHALRLQSADPQNPYAAPVSAERQVVKHTEKIGVWRDGSQLVMHIQATLPERCIVTGQPTQQRHWQTIRWNQPVDWADRACVLEYGITPEVLKSQRKLPIPSIVLSMIGWVIVGLGCTAIGVEGNLNDEDLGHLYSTSLAVGGIFTGICFIPAIIARRQQQNFQLQTISKPYLWLSGPSEAFLQTLPPWLDEL